METVKIAELVPADYNPRRLSEENLAVLMDSIRELGILKPVLVNARNGVIVAGHQRTRAMSALGITETPCYMLDGLDRGAEVRFNQIHNLCEYEVSDRAPKVRVTGTLEEGFSRVPASRLVIEDIGTMNRYCTVVGSLIIKYGDFCAPIVTLSGEVIVSAGYAKCAKLLGRDCDLFVVADGMRERVLHYFGRSYGEFNYDMIERRTYNQTRAQMFRLRDSARKGKTITHSTLYERFILPWLAEQPDGGRGLRLLDFGAGQYDYARMLEARGFDITYVDPYHRDRHDRLTVGDTKRRFLSIIRDLRTRGQYDAVVADSVLNSVDSAEAERSVIDTVFGLCRDGGMMFLSGRTLESKNINDRLKGKNTAKNYTGCLKWLDSDNLSGIYHFGEWFFQKFHSRRQVDLIAGRLSSSARVVHEDLVWKIVARKDIERPDEEIIRGLRFEFDLLLPEGRRFGLADEIQEAYENRRTPDNSLV